MDSRPDPSTPRNPEEELTRFRLLLTADSISPSPSTVATEQAVITVRYKRRLLVWTASVCWPLAPVTFALGLYLMITFDLESQLLLFLLHFPPTWCALMATYFLMQQNYLIYDVRRRRVWSGTGQIRRALGRWREGDRLHYSIYRGRLERVRPNGRRRAIAGSGYVVDQSSWTAFVDAYLPHQNEESSDERSDGDAAPVPVVKVGIRWKLFTVLLLGGLAGGACSFWLGSAVAGALPLVAAGYFLFGALPLILRPVLIYDAGRVSVKYPGRATQELPRPGFERLEYSVYTGSLYEVRADGKRRRVARGWAREQTAWKVFVDRFLDDHASSRDSVDQEVTR